MSPANDGEILGGQNQDEERGVGPQSGAFSFTTEQGDNDLEAAFWNKEN